MQNDGSYMVPRKAIHNNDDLLLWERSATHEDITKFVDTVGAAGVGKKVSDPCHESDATQSCLSMLATVQGLLNLEPKHKPMPMPKPMRKRNPLEAWIEEFPPQTDHKV